MIIDKKNPYLLRDNGFLSELQAAGVEQVT